ncbi:MAG: DMT family transporter [Alphaproteobacteria bacterium]
MLSPPHFVFLVSINLVWAMALAAARIGTLEIPPLLFTGLRFLLLSMILLPFLDLHPGRMRSILAVGLCGGALQFAFLFTGIRVAGDLSAVALASQLGLPFSTLLAVVFLREQVGWRRWTGIACAFTGVIIVSYDPRVLAYWEGLFFGVAAALSASIGTVIMRGLRDIGIFELQAWVAIISWPVLLSLSVMLEGSPQPWFESAGWRGWGAIAFTALVSNLFAHAGMFYLLKRYEVSLLSPLNLMTPVFTVTIGVAFLGDVLTAQMATGGALILLGVGIITARRPQYLRETEPVR